MLLSKSMMLTIAKHFVYLKAHINALMCETCFATTSKTFMFSLVLKT